MDGFARAIGGGIGGFVGNAAAAVGGAIQGMIGQLERAVAGGALPLVVFAVIVLVIAWNLVRR